MFSYTTCRRCRGLLQVSAYAQNCHPDCSPCPTALERLTSAWLNAVGCDDPCADALEAQIHELDAQPPRLLAAALAYAQWDWPVFPLWPRSKEPATRHGFKDASTDPDRITAYWERRPDANIGLPTGLCFDVIDLDGPDGVWSYDRLLTSDRVPDVHGRVSTPHGTHLYVRTSGAGNRASILPGIDIRGRGGYAVAPPSETADGRWAWTVHPSPVLTGVTGG